MTLPPYDPAAAGRIPADQPLTSDQLISRYKISKSQWHNRKNALPHIQGFTQGRKKLFSPAEIYQMDAVDYYISSGFSLDDVTDAYEGAKSVTEEEAFDVQPLNSSPHISPNTQELSLAITPQVEALSNQMGAMIVKAV